MCWSGMAGCVCEAAGVFLRGVAAVLGLSVRGGVEVQKLWNFMMANSAAFR